MTLSMDASSDVLPQMIWPSTACGTWVDTSPMSNLSSQPCSPVSAGGRQVHEANTTQLTKRIAESYAFHDAFWNCKRSRHDQERNVTHLQAYERASAICEDSSQAGHSANTSPLKYGFDNCIEPSCGLAPVGSQLSSGYVGSSSSIGDHFLPNIYNPGYLVTTIMKVAPSSDRSGVVPVATVDPVASIVSTSSWQPPELLISYSVSSNCAPSLPCRLQDMSSCRAVTTARADGFSASASVCPMSQAQATLSLPNSSIPASLPPLTTWTAPQHSETSSLAAPTTAAAPPGCVPRSLTLASFPSLSTQIAQAQLLHQFPPPPPPLQPATSWTSTAALFPSTAAPIHIPNALNPKPTQPPAPYLGVLAQAYSSYPKPQQSQASCPAAPISLAPAQVLTPRLSCMSGPARPTGMFPPCHALSRPPLPQPLPPRPQPQAPKLQSIQPIPTLSSLQVLQPIQLLSLAQPLQQPLQQPLPAQPQPTQAPQPRAGRVRPPSPAAPPLTVCAPLTPPPVGAWGPEDWILHVVKLLGMSEPDTARLALHCWRRVEELPQLHHAARLWPTMAGGRTLYATACLWLSIKLEEKRRAAPGGVLLAHLATTTPAALCSAELAVMNWLGWRPYEGYRLDESHLLVYM